MRLLKLFRSKPKPSDENINPTTEKCDDVKTAEVGKWIAIVNANR